MFIGSMNEVVQSILTQVLSEAVQENGASAKGDQPLWDGSAWVLKPRRVLLSVLWVVLIGFGVAAGVVSFSGGAFLLACLLGAVAIAAGVGLLCWRRAILRIDHTTFVSPQMLGGRPVTMYHDEIVDVRYSPFLRSFVLVDSVGQRVYLSIWVRGVQRALKEMAIENHHLRVAAASQF